VSGLTIGRAARASGVSAKRIRHYEAIGLLRPAERTEAGYRLYTPADLHELRFIASARALGFSIAKIAELLDLWRNRERASADVKALALEQAAMLRGRIAELEAMAGTLETLAARCEGGARPDCPILEGLAGGSPGD
jgi:Cu(I)-responsive transcriptional regulator